MGWLLYLIIFALGGLGGWLLAKSRNPDTRLRELETHLTDLQGKYDHYQESVTQHFASPLMRSSWPGLRALMFCSVVMLLSPGCVLQCRECTSS